jgi:RHS repeat-associated protein
LGNAAVSDYYSNWTWPDIASVPTTAPPAGATGGGITGLSTWPHYADLRAVAHEQGKNWVYTATYAEEGKKSEVVSYFDGSQRNRQTVTKNNSDNLAIVGESYYDFIGRPTVQALPTPVNDATLKFYQQTVGTKTGFNFDSVQDSAFSKRVFALASGPGQCGLGPVGFDNLYGTGKYYSINNPFIALNTYNGYTPLGENYPFSQTEYTPDNTGKISRQGGVGSMFKLETAPGTPKRDTRYFYGSVAQDELDRLFGSEAGYASHYSKTMVVDPNGQASLSYLNQSGKVVATALSAGKPANLQALLAADGVTDLSTTSGVMEMSILNNSTVNNNELVTSEKILVSAAQTYFFDYSLKGLAFQPPSCSSVYDCIYDIEFDITDKCGNRPAGFTPITDTLGKITGTYPALTTVRNYNNSSSGPTDNKVDFNFSQILPPPTTQLAVALDVGEYTVTKKLKINQTALRVYLKDYLANCANQPSSFDVAEAANLNTAGCEFDCKECADAVGATKAIFAANNPNLTPAQVDIQYPALIKACYEPCAYDSYCDAAIQSMMLDMSPSGQYAEYKGSGASFDASAYQLSIFNADKPNNNNLLPRSTTASAPSWRKPVHYINTPVSGSSGYYDEYNVPDRVSVFQTAPGSGVYMPPVVAGAVLTAGTGINEFYAKPEDLANASDFVANFKPSWAQSLIKYHPEYCYVEWCLKNTTNIANIPIQFNKYDLSNPNVPVIISPPITTYIKSSDNYDSLYASIDDIDDIDLSLLPSPYGSVNSLDILFSPLTYDPYWTAGTGAASYYVAAVSSNYPGVSAPNPADNLATAGNVNQLQSTSSALPADFSSNTTMYPAQKSLKTANNRFFNYMGTGLTIYQYAALMATPLAQQYGQPASALLSSLISSTYYSTPPVTGKDYILNIKKPLSLPTDDSYKRKAWDNFKTLYLSMKQQLQQEAAQSYVMNGGCRGCNDCIGKADFEAKKVKFTTYDSDVIPQLLGFFAVTTCPFNPVSFVNGLNNLVAGLLVSMQKNWYTPLNSSGQYVNNKSQICGLATKDLYVNKIKRFYVNEDAASLVPGGGAQNAQATIYAQTGLCPNAYDLQNFLNGMLSNGNKLFTASPGIDLNNDVPEFSQTLYQAILPNIPSPFQAANYAYDPLTSTTSNLVAKILIGSNMCNFNLQMPASVVLPIPSNIINWSLYQGGTPTYKINQFVSFQPTSGAGNPFSVVAVVSTVGSNPSTYTISLTGNSCIPLTGCNFVPPCKANGNGKALNALLNAFAGNAAFPAPYTTSYQTGFLVNPSTAPYNNVFVNSFKPLLETGAPVTTWQWTYNGSNQMLISDGSSNNTNKQLRITFTTPFVFNPAPGSSNITPNISCIQSFQNFQPDPAVPGGFIVEGITSTAAGCQAGTLIVKGKLELGVYYGNPTNAYVFFDMEVGRCSFDLTTCNTKEHEAKRDLEKWVLATPPVNGGFATMLNSATAQNISNNILFTPLLRSYLNSATGSSAGVPQQNFYHWLPDATNTNVNQISGWITVSQNQTAPSVAPAGSCYLTVKKIVPPIANCSIVNTTPIGTMLNSNIGGVFKVLTDPIIGNNAYSFKLLTNTFNCSDSVLVTTTCFPLRECNTLNCVTEAPYNIQSFDCNAPSFNFTLIDQTANSYAISNSCNGSAVNINNTGTAFVFNSLPPPGPFPGSGAVFASLSSVPSINNCPSCSLLYGQPNAIIYGLSLYNRPYGEGYLAFTNNASALCPPLGVPCCSSGNIRSTTYQQNFNLLPGTFNLSFYFQNASQTSICSNVVPPPLPETINVFIDNTSVFSFPFVAGLNLVTFPLPSAILPGNHTLKLVFTHNNLQSIYALFPIQLTKNNLNVLPCVNTPWPTDTMPTAQYEEPCAAYLQDLIDNTADEKYDDYLEGAKAKFIRDYTAFALANASEKLKMKYNNGDYHYTLYYYDQAGNLVRTVPPAGVKPVNLSTIYSGVLTNGDVIKQDRVNFPSTGVRTIYTQHNFLTTYSYNSLNQLIKQETPDAGISKFYYDNLGRLVASQNAEQKFQSTISTDQKYSYTKYDALGRITMVGQLGTYDLDAYPGIPVNQSIKDYLSAPTYPLNLTIAANSHVQVTETVYGDDPTYTPLIPGNFFTTGQQQNLRGRVASATIEDVYDGSRPTFDHATHYSYDIHGNVKELVQHNPSLSRFTYINSQPVKRLEYNYDLISGKVNAVTYQKNEPDMFIHKYGYDAANRLTNVCTSRDGYTWNQDAKYYYYLHGPLARTELGEHKVQSNDYAYTLQGWLKGVNSEALKSLNDMGKDGYTTLTATGNYLNRFNAKDAYGYGLYYYTSANASAIFDYKPVNASDALATTNFLGNLGTAVGLTQLFNGNISAMSACYLSLDPSPISITNLASAVTVNKYTPYCFLKTYAYDQLNRIRSARAGAKAINASVAWMFTNAGALANEFAEDFKYDQNGNLLKVDRRLAAANYDNLTYFYYNASGVAYNPVSPPANTIPTNKLAYVTDAYTPVSYNDIGNQALNNYTYDKIGNLIGDAAENISGISWNVYGKIKSITRNTTTKPNMEFKYDASGNRISKKVINATTGITTITYYVRDAQGNTMATYVETATSTTNKLALTELPIYGSSRLGLQNCNTTIGDLVSNVGTGNIAYSPESNRVLGSKSYELSNHLGNVLAVVSDRKLLVDDGVYNATGGSQTSTVPDGNADYYVADITSATDYYAFGSPMPGRNFNNGSYRYGFNGKEKDDEVKGGGNSLDFGARMYDSRLGRFLSVDPLAKSFAWNSPYTYAENDVIRCIDLDGLEKVVVFGGADLMNTGLSKTTIQTAADIQKFSDDNKLGYDVKTFNVAPWNPSQGTAFTWIKDNYKKGESIIIYGYSMGGVAANQLAKMLKTEGITVNLLVPVDAAFGPMGQPLNISDNVETVFNIYQTEASPIFSHGYPAAPIAGNDKTTILNDNMTGKTTGVGKDAHGTMDEDTKTKATNIIKAEMSGKLDGIIKDVVGPKKEDGSF